MDVNVILSIIGVAVAVVSAIVAYLQLKHQIREKNEGGDTTSKSHPDSFSLFAPLARIQGLAQFFIGRRQELALMKEVLRREKSLIIVEGVAGVGKTSLVANFLCSSFVRLSGYKIGWIFCSERYLKIDTLIKSIAGTQDLPRDGCLNQLATGETNNFGLIDCLIQYLSAHKVLLVLDDIHLSQEPEIIEFIKIVSRSRLRSTIILTSEIQLDLIDITPLIEIIELRGLRIQDVSSFLKTYGKDIKSELQKILWEKAGNGVPEAMRILVGLSYHRPLLEVLEDIPHYSKSLDTWLERIFQSITMTEFNKIKFMAFSNEPVSIQLLESVYPEKDQLVRELTLLRDKFLLTHSGKMFLLHPLIQDYARERTSEDERLYYSTCITNFYAKQARDLLMGISEEPSYGKVYLEAHPDYVMDYAYHEWFVDNLIGLLRKNNFILSPGSMIMVLGAGHGTHDAGYAKYGLRILNIELLEEVVEIGRRNAKDLDCEIEYLLADMTKELDVTPGSMDAVFNIGSAFGFEAEDSKNEMIFLNAARSLKQGCPFVFEYCNGIYWTSNIEKRIEVVNLPSGAIRTKFKISNPVKRIGLDIVKLERPDGSVSVFHHFNHNYTLEEVTAMMKRSGLEPISIYGSVNGESYDAKKSSSMVIIGKKEG